MIESKTIKENPLFGTQIEDIFNINDEILNICHITELATRQDFENLENTTINYIIEKIFFKSCDIRMALSDIKKQLEEK